jgi:antitoxin YefM
MLRQVSYSFARQNLAAVLDEAEEAQEPVIITRRGREDVALIPAAELRSLEETAHLFRSPENARRLLSALEHALEGSVEPRTARQLRDEVGLT